MKYKTVKEKNIINGTTTVSFGEMKVDDFDRMATNAILNTAEELLYGSIESKGVAKLADGDTYDKNTGLKVASIKAELKAREKADKRYRKMWQQLDEALGILERRGHQNMVRMSVLAQELDKLNK